MAWSCSGTGGRCPGSRTSRCRASRWRRPAAPAASCPARCIVGGASGRPARPAGTGSGAAALRPERRPPPGRRWGSLGGARVGLVGGGGVAAVDADSCSRSTPTGRGGSIPCAGRAPAEPGLGDVVRLDIHGSPAVALLPRRGPARSPGQRRRPRLLGGDRPGRRAARGALTMAARMIPAAHRRCASGSRHGRSA